MLRRALLLTLVFSLAARAEEQPAGPGTASPPPVSPWRTTGYVASTTGVSLGVGLLCAVLGGLVYDARVQATGRPEPLFTAALIGVGAGLNLAVTHWLFPEFARLADGDGVRGDAAQARRWAWKQSRWAALGVGAGVASFTLGAALERTEFGRGQWPMLAGAVVTVLGLFVWDTLEAVATWSGFLSTREAP